MLHLCLIVVIFAGLSMPVHRCACCPEDGEWFEERQAVDQWLLTELDTLSFHRSAEASPYSEGTSLASDSDSFTLSVSRRQRQWTFVFKSDKGERGALVLSIPHSSVSFGTDLHDGRRFDAGGPLLYKELRLEGKVWGNGVFAKSIRPNTKFRLGGCCRAGAAGAKYRGIIETGTCAFLGPGRITLFMVTLTDLHNESGRLTGWWALFQALYLCRFWREPH
jgi:hypothetical protein